MILKLKKLFCAHPQQMITTIGEIKVVKLLGKGKDFLITIKLCHKCHKVISKFSFQQ